jgi:CO/xanthine dehydrogenase Mo-binding subunit
MRVTSNGVAECLDKVEAASRWKERRGKMPYGRGLGVATSAYISGTNYAIYPNQMPQSAVQLKVDRSGVVTIFSGQSEIGQGCDTMLAVLVADELGLDLGAIRVISGDTDLTPVDLGAYSSRGTFMNGNAALHAAQQVRTKMVDAVAEKLGVAPREILVTRGALCVAKDPTQGVPVTEAIQSPRRSSDARRRRLLQHTGSRRRIPGGTIGARQRTRSPRMSPRSVDAETRRVDVKTIWARMTVGKAICPTLVEGQMEGSAYMGAAEALLEEHVIGADGLHMGPNLLDYRIPTSLDVPELVALLVESNDPEGPRGAKEAGEGPLHPSIPAIANAIYDAVGVRIDRLPFSPSRVKAALREKEARERHKDPVKTGSPVGAPRAAE